MTVRSALAALPSIAFDAVETARFCAPIFVDVIARERAGVLTFLSYVSVWCEVIAEPLRAELISTCILIFCSIWIVFPTSMLCVRIHSFAFVDLVGNCCRPEIVSFRIQFCVVSLVLVFSTVSGTSTGDQSVSVRDAYFLARS